MKTTMMFRSIANPRRTTLAHLTDADVPQLAATAEPMADEQHTPLPQRTANPRRTVLVDAPHPLITGAPGRSTDG